MPEPLTRTQMDQAGCGTPDCGHDHTVLYLHSKCHAAAGSRVSYNKSTGLGEADPEVIRLKSALLEAVSKLQQVVRERDQLRARAGEI